MKEGEPKLTEAKAKLYAEKRRIMPENSEIPAPHPEREPRIPNIEYSAGLANLLERREAREGKKGAVETSITKSTEFMEHLQAVEARGEEAREVEQAFGFMLVALNETTKQQPLRQWSDERLAMIYQEFQEFSDDLKEEIAKGASPEDVARNHDMLGMVGGVKELLAGAAEDKDGVLTGSVLEKQERERSVARRIKNREIREKLELLAERLDNGTISSRAEILAARREWKELGDSYEGKLDAETKEAMGKMSNYLQKLLQKTTIAREIEKPQTTTSARSDAGSESDNESSDQDEEATPERDEEEREESAEEEVPSDEIAELLKREKRDEFLTAKEREKIQKYNEEREEKRRKEEGRSEVERAVEEEQAKLAKEGLPGKTADERERIIKARLHMMTAEQTANRLEQLLRKKASDAEKEAKKSEEQKERDRVKKEKNRQWKQEKKTFAKLRDQAAEIQVDADWSVYGWTQEQKEEIAMEHLKLSSLEKAEPILIGLLLQGKTGAEAIAEVSGVGQVRGYTKEALFQNKFLNDFDAGRTLGLSPTEIDDIREERWDRSNPTNMQELAWQISIKDPELFGENGSHPVWERRVRQVWVDEEGRRIGEDGKVTNAQGDRIPAEGTRRIKFETHEVVNEDNFILWFRERVNFWQGQGPSERYNFYEQIKLQKSLSTLSLSRMLEAEATMFTGSGDESVPDEYLPEHLQGKMAIKEDYLELSEMLQVEAALVTMVRQFHLAYDENKGSEEELYKQVQGLFDKNHLTKKVWGGKPLWQFITILPEKFSTLDKLDGGVGASVVKSYLSYYHLSDFEKLMEVLGKEQVDENGKVSYDVSESKLFTVEGLREARDAVKVGQEAYGEIDNPDEDVFDFSYRMKNGTIDGFNNSAVDKAFRIVEVYKDKNGKLQARTEVKNKRAFIALINIFGDYTNSVDMESIVDKIIKDESVGVEKLNDINKNYAHLIAKHLTRFTGAAAENDIEFVGYDAMTRMGHLRGYRAKMLEGKVDKDGNVKNRGGEAGNPNTIDQFKRLVVNPMLGIVTVNGKPILQVMHELHSIRQKMDRRLEQIPMSVTGDDEGKVNEEVRRLIEKEKEQTNQEYREKARELRFKKNTEQHYLQNHFNRGLNLYAIIRGGQGINLHDFGGYNPEIGFYFKRDKFQQEVIKKLITTARYAFSTYGSLKYDMIIRGYDYDMTLYDEHGKVLKDEAGNVIKGGWRDMPLGEAMFGKHMMSRKEFMTDGDIDWKKVQKNQGLLFKQWILTYFAGEFNAYRQFRKWSTDPRNEFWWYEDIINALEKIPGNWEGNEEDMRKINISEYFFDKESINWLRKASGTTKANLYGMAALRTLLLGKMGSKDESVWGGFGEAFRRFMAAVGSGH